MPPVRHRAGAVGRLLRLLCCPPGVRLSASLQLPRNATQAVSIPKRAKEITGLVSAAMSRLEKDKAALTLDKEQDKVHCEAFALRVFANADRTDRLGKADAGTAKGFYAAFCFFDVRARSCFPATCAAAPDPAALS